MIEIKVRCDTPHIAGFTNNANYSGTLNAEQTVLRVVDDEGDWRDILMNNNPHFIVTGRVTKPNDSVSNKIVPTLISQIANWHHERNLIDGADDFSQFTKLIEEAGELASNVSRGRDIRDDIGDMIVVLINIAERNQLTIEECMQIAWDDIKDRRGMMLNGTFIKEADLGQEDRRSLSGNRTDDTGTGPDD